VAEDAVHLPSPCLVVLVGPSASGKSTWAAGHFAPHQVVSSDALRAVVGEGEDDLLASAAAFEVLELVVARRLARRLTTVVDTLGLDATNRGRWRTLAREHGMACVAVAFTTPAAECRARNRSAPRPIPAAVLDAQVRAFAATRPQLADEGYDAVLAPTPVRVVAAPFVSAPAAAARQATEPLGLRFGLQLSSFTGSGGSGALAERLRRIAGSAEDAGFDSLWVMDHLRQIPQVGRPWDDLLESWTTLAHLAAVTDRVRLGTLVTGITLRNVGHLGKIVATLDVLSEGRAVCGVGAGWFAEEQAAYGITLPPLAERYAVLEDALRLLPLLWGPGSPSFAGKVLTVPEALCYPRPLQPKVPIVVGGQGERRTLKLAAELADGCNLFGDVPTVEHKVSVLRRHLDAAERDPAEVEVTHLSTVLVGRDDAEVAALVERLRPPRRSPQAFAASVHAGMTTDHVGRCRELAEAGVQHVIVALAGLDDVEPIERMAGVIAAYRRG
jgi:F420-dependent oxidoreductase-like protein